MSAEVVLVFGVAVVATAKIIGEAVRSSVISAINETRVENWRDKKEEAKLRPREFKTTPFHVASSSPKYAVVFHLGDIDKNLFYARLRQQFHENKRHVHCVRVLSRSPAMGLGTTIVVMFKNSEAQERAMETGLRLDKKTVLKPSRALDYNQTHTILTIELGGFDVEQVSDLRYSMAVWLRDEHGDMADASPAATHPLSPGLSILSHRSNECDENDDNGVNTSNVSAAVESPYIMPGSMPSSPSQDGKRCDHQGSAPDDDDDVPPIDLNAPLQYTSSSTLPPKAAWRRLPATMAAETRDAHLQAFESQIVAIDALVDTESGFSHGTVRVILQGFYPWAAPTIALAALDEKDTYPCKVEVVHRTARQRHGSAPPRPRT
ncbi:hypothetical protein BC940DRAFT_310828 [Gongronella butleri]|nr:hypothetical protein BC940DRAFT_310828 [Gongronella butleri]